MPYHISVRLAWHDTGWNGRICKNPKANAYCVGPHSYPGDLIALGRDLDWEEKFKIISRQVNDLKQEKKRVLPTTEELEKLPDFDKHSRDQLGLDDYKPKTNDYFDHLEKEANLTVDEDSLKYDEEQKEHDEFSKEKDKKEDENEFKEQSSANEKSWTEHDDISKEVKLDSTWSAPDPSEVHPEPQPKPKQDVQPELESETSSESEPKLEPESGSEMVEASSVDNSPVDDTPLERSLSVESSEEKLIEEDSDDEVITEGEDFVVTHNTAKDEVDKVIQETDSKIAELESAVHEELLKIDNAIERCRSYLSTKELDLAKHSYNLARELFANSSSLTEEEQHQYHDILLGLYQEITQTS